MMNIHKVNVVSLMILNVIILLSSCKGTSTVRIVEQKGNDVVEHCLSDGHYDLKSCIKDLPLILNSNATDIQVLFCSTVFHLNISLEFYRINNVSFIGSPSTFKCSDDAGLAIHNSTNVHISNITLDHCGILHNSTAVDVSQENAFLPFRSAMYVFDSTNIALEGITISNSNGIGLTFIDTDGDVEVKLCKFVNNSVSNDINNETEVISGGGGVYLEFTYCSVPSWFGDCECKRNINVTDSVYHFDRCQFTGNNATNIYRMQTDFFVNEGNHYHGLGNGGGLNVAVRGTATRNRIILNGCNFIHNSAVWGGGLKVTFFDAASNNSFVASNCVFDHNQCIDHAGGGADVGYSYYSSPFPHGNAMAFNDCNFTNNIAKFGGGLAFYSSTGSYENLNNSVQLNSCRWRLNKARFGSAVDISAHAWATFVNGYLPSPQFRDSVFYKNYVIHESYDYRVFSVYKKGNGAFLSTKFTIYFVGTVNFTDNNGSAMFLVSSVAIFKPYTSVVFHNNSGFNGGAIALLGFSVLILSNNMSLVLSYNTAVRCGGAIYSYSIDKHDYISSRSCFIQNANVNKNNEWENCSVNFIHNSAGIVGTNTSKYCGDSIYATTLLPCHFACRKSTGEDKVTVNGIFACFGNFTFENSSREYQLTTSGANFTFADQNVKPVKIIPNKREELPVALIDDLEQSVDAEIFLGITGGSEHTNLDQSYAFLSDNKTVLYGQPGDAGYLTLSKTTIRANAITLKFEVQECPPGYINVHNKCTCSVGSKQYYSPIYACNHSEFVAIAWHGYWIGYVDGETENNLLYSYCPSRRCFYRQQQYHSHRLTRYASQKKLDRLVCGNETTGILCGSCRKGYSVTYHSIYGFCSEKSCKFGWLLYIISELLPITLLFVVVILLNISFVTGELNGFIFFAQMFDSVSITAQGFIQLPTHSQLTIRIARFLYSFFNFDFFRLDELSFCLWKEANTLDMLAFKYVTVAYASLLIAVTIWLMNKCNIYRKFYCLRASTMRASITHGLSAFLVMVYAQCAIVSLKLLDFTYLYSVGHKYNRTVVTHLGDIQYFQGKHLSYAIPALICVMTIVILPAIVLLLYPSCFKVVAFFHLDDSKCISWTLQRIPHALLKPFVDSFQSCFKDNLRFFAGLYFVYRLAILTSWLMSSQLTQRFLLLELLFVFMLLVHSILQPYKSRFHNILDAFIFFNLSFINGITLYNYHYSKINYPYKIGFVQFQVLLVYLPLVYFVLYTVVCLVNKVRNLCKLKTSVLSIQLRQLMRQSESEEELPSRLEEVLESDGSVNDYQLYEEQTDESNRTTY